MKRIFLLLIAAGGAFSVNAQAPNANNSMDSTKSVADTTTKHTYKKEGFLPRWVLDANFMVGVLTQDITKANTDPNYTNGIDLNTGKLKFTNGLSYGGDIQVGRFFGKKAHFGVGIGFMYLYQTGDLTLDQFRVQYQSIDAMGSTFRQIITANAPVKEQLVMQNMNIPLVFKYKTRFSKHFGFTSDLGLLYNVQIQNAYKTNASFDYEAIYAFASSGDGKVAVYDNQENPSNKDWLITKDQITKHYGADVAVDTFNSYRGLNYNVGLGVKPKPNGNTTTTSGSFGLLARPAITYYFSDKVAMDLGVYYIYQPVKNNAQSGYRLTDKLGDYSSLTNSETKIINQTYGGTIGVRFYLGYYNGKPQEELKITEVDSTNPTVCGMVDGTITLRGLPAGEPVTVNYIYNGTPQTAFSDTVTPFGTVKLSKLAAGHYTGIVATVGEENAKGPDVHLVNPPLGVYSQSSTNPSTPGACDGTIRMHGLHPGISLTINYSFNGTPAKPFKGVIAADGTIKITNLCAGKYTNIVGTSSSCSVNGIDVTLTDPPVLTAPNKPERPDVATPILFDFNMTTIHPVSYPVLMEAVIELNEDENTSIVIDGYTDNVGSAGYNEKLSNKRASAVKTYLTNNGISPKRLKSVGHGLNSPVAPNDTPEGRAKNRRVTMTLQHNK